MDLPPGKFLCPLKNQLRKGKFLTRILHIYISHTGYSYLSNLAHFMSRSFSQASTAVTRFLDRLNLLRYMQEMASFISLHCLTTFSRVSFTSPEWIPCENIYKSTIQLWLDEHSCNCTFSLIRAYCIGVVETMLCVHQNHFIFLSTQDGYFSPASFVVSWGHVTVFFQKVNGSDMWFLDWGN